MNSIRFPVFYLITLPLVLLPITGFTQAAPTENIDYSVCASIPEASARLACYDGLTSQTQSSTGNQSDEATESVQGNRRVGEEIARLRNRSDSSQATPIRQNDIGAAGSYIDDRRTGDRSDLIDYVADLQTGPSGWIVTLKQGQVWRQMINKRYQLRKGQEVRIYPSIWGNSYRLSAESNEGYIQVERIR